MAHSEHKSITPLILTQNGYVVIGRGYRNDGGQRFTMVSPIQRDFNKPRLTTDFEIPMGSDFYLTELTNFKQFQHQKADLDADWQAVKFEYFHQLVAWHYAFGQPLQDPLIQFNWRP